MDFLGSASHYGMFIEGPRFLGLKTLALLGKKSCGSIDWIMVKYHLRSCRDSPK